MTDILLALGIIIAVSLCLGGVPIVLRRTSISGPLTRNIMHAASFVLCAAGIYFAQHKWLPVGLGLVATVILIVGIERNWMPAIMHGSRLRDYGLVGSAIGITIVVGLFFEQKLLVVMALLVVGLADPLASIIGRRFGRHIIAAWGSQRSVEGSIAFASVTFLISLLFFTVSQTGIPYFIVIGFSLFVALTTAVLELIIPSAIDNIAIPTWVSFLFFMTGTPNFQPDFRWLIAVLLSLLMLPILYRLKWVDAAGTAGVLFVSVVVIGLGGWVWFVPIAAFFTSGSLLTRLHQSNIKVKNPRTIRQVTTNGIIPILPILGYAINGHPIWYFLHIGAVATANADTWATELGRFAKKPPISLRTFQPVSPGISGAVSSPGLFASILGGLFIGVIATLINSSTWRFYLLLVGFLIGPLGSLVDSVLGAWVQSRYWCLKCNQVTEDTTRCCHPKQLYSGIPGIDNNAVNALANLAGILMSFQLFHLVF